jgi:hypothetical protein
MNEPRECITYAFVWQIVWQIFSRHAFVSSCHHVPKKTHVIIFASRKKKIPSLFTPKGTYLHSHTFAHTARATKLPSSAPNNSNFISFSARRRSSLPCRHQRDKSMGTRERRPIIQHGREYSVGTFRGSFL